MSVSPGLSRLARSITTCSVAAAALDEHLEIPTRLRGLHDAERVCVPGHGEVRRVVARDLEEHARVQATLVRLPGGVQEARSEAHARRDAVAIPDGPAHRLQLGLGDPEPAEPARFVGARPEAGIACPEATHFPRRRPLLERLPHALLETGA